MATTTYFCDDTADGQQLADHSPYDADGAATNSTPTATDIYVGQNLGYSLRQCFLVFDLASPTTGVAIPAGSTINSATFSVWADDMNTTDPFIIHACAYDWGTTYGGDDRRSVAQMTALYNGGAGEFAHANASTSWPYYGNGGDAWVAFTSGSHMVADIAAAIGGNLRLVLFSSEHMAASAPTAHETVAFAAADNATQTIHPKLVVTYTAPAVWSGLIVTRKLQG